MGMLPFMDERGDEGPVAGMPLAFSPRDYQLAADAAVASYLTDHDRCGLYLATGTGKTEIAFLLMSRCWDGMKLFIAPRRELVRQTAERFRKRGLNVGIEMAADRSDEEITVACYASLRSRNRYQRFLKGVKLVIVDEAHINYSPDALDMLKEFRSFGAKVVAMTASPPSKKNFILPEHYGEPAYIYSYMQAVQDGYLVPCVMHLCVLDELDLSRFKASFGDFDPGRLSKLMQRRANVAAVGAMVEKFWQCEPSVVFCASIAHAEAVRDDLTGRGIGASIVHSQMSQEEIDLHLRDFATGNSNVIINVGILTLGWDCPHIRNIFIARCTASSTLYTQVFRRGTRPLPGVVDRYNTAEERRAAIARSAKPCFKVYDITDSSRHNSIVTALDVLYPASDKVLMRRVRRRTEGQQHTLDALDRIVEQERRALAAETAAREREEMQRRKHISVGASVSAYERDISAPTESRGDRRTAAREYRWMPFGRYRGKPFTKIPRQYLSALLPHCRDKALSESIRRFLSRG